MGHQEPGATSKTLKGVYMDIKRFRHFDAFINFNYWHKQNKIFQPFQKYDNKSITGLIMKRKLHLLEQALTK